MNGLDRSNAVNQVTAHLNAGHLGKGAHLRRVALNAFLHGLSRGAFLVPGCAARHHQRSGHALQVPLERSANGLVEVVDVEDQTAVGCGKGAQVAHMRVAAELGCKAGVGQHGQVRGHHRNCAAKEAEGRVGHELILELDERGNAALHRPRQQIESRRLARLGRECVVFLAAYLLAPRLAQLAPFFGSHPLHEPHHTPSVRATQPG
jgi:hypothetical protein